MTLLRVLLVAWLLVAVPTTALAGLFAGGQCRMAQASASKMAQVHAGHRMQSADLDGDGATMALTGDGPNAESEGCTCDCSCTGTHHCTSGGSGFLGNSMTEGVRLDEVDRGTVTADVTQVASAHHLDLLRPPTRA